MRFQDGKLSKRDSEAIINALLRFHERDLTEEELVATAAEIGRHHQDRRFGRRWARRLFRRVRIWLKATRSESA
jgi:hypothetical protein